MTRLIRLIVVLLLALVVGGGVQATPLAQQIDSLIAFSTVLRADLEITANTVFGTNNRPDNWTGNVNNTTLTYISDLWFDKELLANEAFKDANLGISDPVLAAPRPDNWLGITVDVDEIIARNSRHDLELIADEIFGFDIRPPGWNGSFPLYRCNRTLQNTYALLVEFYGFETSLDENSFGFCTLIEDGIRRAILDVNLLDIGGTALDQKILDTRGDIERIANEVYGVNNRPLGWAGNTDIESQLLITDNYADLNILADDTLGNGTRPRGWIGLITESKVETYRNLRYDLELLADVVVPTLSTIEGERPRGWQESDPLRSCTPLIQDLILVIEPNFPLEPQTPEEEELGIPLNSFNRINFPDTDDYCSVIEESGNLFIESRALRVVPGDVLAGDGAFTAEYAFAYLDLTVLEFMGIMPSGTPFKAWYRNYNDSKMMFVSGQDFAVYIDRRWTTMPQDIFDRLPTIEGIRPLTFCNADWCNGPGPTPTPTGGAIESLLAFQTPIVVATLSPEDQLSLEDKTQVNFENIRIGYVQDNIQTRTALITLELCQEPQLITCEAVTSVFDQALDAPKSVLSSANGLNVYEFPYGYTASLLIESPTLVSRDIFVADQTLPRN